MKEQEQPISPNASYDVKYVKTDNTEHWHNADNKLHRVDGPAMIYYENGQKIYKGWFRNGERHRDDGPAKIFYKNGQKTDEWWYHNDKLHRDDGPAEIWYKNGQKIREYWIRNGKFGGNVLAYVWLADIDDYPYIYVTNAKNGTIDAFRDAVKGPLALEIMRPLPIPIRETIYEHYCLQ